MKRTLLYILVITALVSCRKDTPEEPEFFVNEDPSTFAEVGSIDIGQTGAAEISAYDPETKRLFVVRNEGEGTANQINRIEILDLKDPASIKTIANINIVPFGGALNSVAVAGGKLAAAIQGIDKTANGKVVVFNTTDYSKIAEINVGALPDMVTFSPDGKFILAANEGEPNDSYTNDPSGTISIITVNDNYAVTTIDFSSMVSQEEALKLKGLRIFGPSKSFVKDIEPEYITVSADSKTAWVTLQENNAIARIDIASKSITNIFPLGFKDYNADGNEIDQTDIDATYKAAKWNVKGIFMPDAIAVMEINNIPYLFTANEGDAREYSGFREIFRVRSNDVKLDAAKFPAALTLKQDLNLGRLNVTVALGDTDGDGDLDELYSYGARSFSVWNGLNGSQVFDSKNELDIKAHSIGVYDDARSDDKSVEPEGLAIGTVGSKKVVFVAMERADAVAIYDITSPARPVFLKIIKCGDAPEGVLFVPAKDSPTKRSLLIVSSEGDGVVKIFSPNTI